MLFEVTRTSDWFNDNQPCNESKVIYTNKETKEDVYGVEINSLEELTEFVKNNGRIVLNIYHKTNKANGTIEIYDTYRE